MPLLVFAPATAPASEPVHCENIPELAGGLGHVATLRADYTESRTLSLMSEPLLSKGSILYARPDRLRMATTSPSRQTVTLVGTRLTVVHHDLDRRETMELDRNPIARAVTGNILRVLSGNIDTLGGEYRCTASPVDGGGWRLGLIPLKEPMSKVMRSMTVTVGPDRLVREVLMEEVGGDSSTMTFFNARAGEALSPEAVAAEFGE